MDEAIEVKQHGRRLMVLAACGAVCVLAVGGALLASALFPQALHPWPLFRSITLAPEGLAQVPAIGKGMLGLKALTWTLACLWPLWALYCLGQALCLGNVLNQRTTAAFGQLAHSVAGSLVLQAAPDLIAGFLDGLSESAGLARPFRMTGDFGFNLGVGGTYLAIVACFCLYSIAYLMKLAADAADDARSIV